ncbi:hypothetical protein Htur_3640 [Haloterrigena turkmenica DSM 5511]|uniref:Uncharacterized protein n=1 Tax=Haloterrigena turkmenica (strain ATCC 51198 / DSM 5511 / JCM 9101 / NCIMB 13204 / VKM B-1734 / 4k) TaxID=543526 RepID=D2RRA6_HALTV|nr:hypothetical protein Htur_3640 [Haloterrigena turkmenica DSM 5511]
MYRVSRPATPRGRSHAVPDAASYLPLEVGEYDSMQGTWSDHVDQLLDEREREQHRVDLERATVVVTNRRVLAFTPDEDGPNYRSADRPNVTRVSVETDSAPGRLLWAALFLFLGLGLLLVGTTVDLAGLADDYAGATGDPTGIADAALETLAMILTVFDLSILVGGGLLLALAALWFAGYARSRTRRLALRVSGGDDIFLPVTDADLETGRAVALEEAIGPDSTPADGDAIESSPADDSATDEPSTADQSSDAPSTNESSTAEADESG